MADDRVDRVDVSAASGVEDEVCDLRNQEGANRFRDAVERKSKVSQAAEANLNGKGVMED